MNRFIMTSEGYRVKAVDDPEKGLEIIKNNHNAFSAVVVDYIMPSMNGIEFTLKLRKWEEDENQPKIPIILCTGHEDVNFKNLAYSSGINDVLLKPISRGKLKDAIISQIPCSYVETKRREHKVRQLFNIFN